MALVLQPPGPGLVHAAAELAQFRQQAPVIGPLRQALAHRQKAQQQLPLLAAAGHHLLQHGAFRVQLRVLVHQHHLQLR